jgi:hypothetical protein
MLLQSVASGQRLAQRLFDSLPAGQLSAEHVDLQLERREIVFVDAFGEIGHFSSRSAGEAQE